MKLTTIILLALFSSSVFSQKQNNRCYDITHFGNYNPPDDSEIDTGWLIVGCFIYLHNGGCGIILSAYGVGTYYDTRKFVMDTEGRIIENRRINHKKQKHKII